MAVRPPWVRLRGFDGPLSRPPNAPFYPRQSIFGFALPGAVYGCSLGPRRNFPQAPLKKRASLYPPITLQWIHFICGVLTAFNRLSVPNIIGPVNCFTRRLSKGAKDVNSLDGFAALTKMCRSVGRSVLPSITYELKFYEKRFFGKLFYQDKENSERADRQNASFV